MNADNQQLRPAELGWIAGMIDGEGHIGHVLRNRDTQRYIPGLWITGTNKQGADFLSNALNQADLGHYIYWSHPTKEGNKPKWEIKIEGLKRTERVIEKFVNLVVIKRLQAELMLSWIDNRKTKAIMDRPDRDELLIVNKIKDINAGKPNDYTFDIVHSEAEALGWLAGMIDGKGSIGIYTAKPTFRSYAPQPRIRIAGTSNDGKNYVDKVLSDFDIEHHVYAQKPHNGTLPVWDIIVYKQSELYKLLKLITPCMSIKAEQATLLSEWLNTKNTSIPDKIKDLNTQREFLTFPKSELKELICRCGTFFKQKKSNQIYCKAKCRNKYEWLRTINKDIV